MVPSLTGHNIDVDIDDLPTEDFRAEALADLSLEKRVLTLHGI